MGTIKGPLGLIREVMDFLLLVVRGHRPRRNLMFGVCLLAMGLVGLGAFPMHRWLEERPVLFLCYWGTTFLVVILLILLALYDILQLLSRR